MFVVPRSVGNMEGGLGPTRNGDAKGNETVATNDKEKPRSDTSASGIAVFVLVHTRTACPAVLAVAVTVAVAASDMAFTMGGAWMAWSNIEPAGGGAGLTPNASPPVSVEPSAFALAAPGFFGASDSDSERSFEADEP